MWVSAKLGLQVIKAYDDMAIDKAKPFDNSVIPTTSENMPKLAKLFGLEGNQAMLSADKAIKRFTGFSPLEVLGVTLVSRTKEVSLSPTNLGLLSDLSLSGQKVNSLLEDIGFQSGFRNSCDVKIWLPTEERRQYCEVADVGKAEHP